MDTTTTPPAETEPQVQQLSLLPDSDVPLKFRLDADTRRRGIQHIAEIRRMLAERSAAREAAQRHAPPTRRSDRAA